eukprot:1207684-Pleurochrysis_carterae.AAC.2
MLRNCKRQQPAGSAASSCACRAARRYPAGVNSDYQAGTRPLAVAQFTSKEMKANAKWARPPKWDTLG